MEQREVRLELPGPIRDLDLAPDGSWVAAVEQGDDLFIHFESHAFRLDPRPKFPIVRFASPHEVIVVDSRTSKRTPNAWIYDAGGTRRAEFCAGDAIMDILADHTFIVPTYFDEGVFGDVDPSPEGLAVFDSKGKYRWGYRTALGAAATDLVDCYCACWGQPGSIWFCAYTSFALVNLDLRKKTQQLLPTPESLHGPGALTVGTDAALFYSPYADPRAIYRWGLDEGAPPEKIGEHPGPLRGLPGGRTFLAIGEAGYALVEF